MLAKSQQVLRYEGLSSGELRNVSDQLKLGDVTRRMHSFGRIRMVVQTSHQVLHNRAG
jgi:hypothetical protein